METRMAQDRKDAELRALQARNDEVERAIEHDRLKRSLMRVRREVYRAESLRDAEKVKCTLRKEHLDFQLSELGRVKELLTLLTSTGSEHVDAHPLLAKLEEVAKSRGERAGTLSKIRQDVANAFVDHAKHSKVESRCAHLEAGFTTAAKLLNIPESDDTVSMLEKVVRAASEPDKAMEDRSAALEARKVALVASLHEAQNQLREAMPYAGFVEGSKDDAVGGAPVASASNVVAAAPDVATVDGLTAAAMIDDAMERREAARRSALERMETVQKRERRAKEGFTFFLDQLQAMHLALDCASLTMRQNISRTDEEVATARKEAMAAARRRRQGTSQRRGSVMGGRSPQSLRPPQGSAPCDAPTSAPAGTTASFTDPEVVRDDAEDADGPPGGGRSPSAGSRNSSPDAMRGGSRNSSPGGMRGGSRISSPGGVRRKDVATHPLLSGMILPSVGDVAVEVPSPIQRGRRGSSGSLSPPLQRGRRGSAGGGVLPGQSSPLRFAPEGYVITDSLGGEDFMSGHVIVPPADAPADAPSADVITGRRLGSTDMLTLHTGGAHASLFTLGKTVDAIWKVVEPLERRGMLRESLFASGGISTYAPLAAPTPAPAPAERTTTRPRPTPITTAAPMVAEFGGRSDSPSPSRRGSRAASRLGSLAADDPAHALAPAAGTPAASDYLYPTPPFAPGAASASASMSLDQIFREDDDALTDASKQGVGFVTDSGKGKEALANELSALGVTPGRDLAFYATAAPAADTPIDTPISRPTTASSRAPSRPPTAGSANAPASDRPQFERQTFLVPGANMEGVPRSPYAKLRSEATPLRSREEMKQASSNLASKEARRRSRAESLARLPPEERMRRQKAAEDEKRRASLYGGSPSSKGRSSILLTEHRPESLAKLMRSASADPESLRAHMAVMRHQQRRGEPTAEEMKAQEDMRLFRERTLV